MAIPFSCPPFPPQGRMTSVFSDPACPLLMSPPNGFSPRPSCWFTSEVDRLPVDDFYSFSLLASFSHPAFGGRFFFSSYNSPFPPPNLLLCYRRLRSPCLNFRLILTVVPLCSQPFDKIPLFCKFFDIPERRPSFLTSPQYVRETPLSTSPPPWLYSWSGPRFPVKM